MAVKEEKPKRISSRSVVASMTDLRRHASGAWSAELRVKLKVELPDGRKVVADRLVTIRAQQEGRRKRR